MVFVETDVFSRRIARLGLETALRDLQLALQQHPEAGDLDPGTGGLRKVRMPDPDRHKGKRGGARVHYLWVPHHQLVYLVFVYAKGEVETLTEEQKRRLRMIVGAIRTEREDRHRG
jgi:hypothetical protein